jgi:hypothetical protein
MAAAPPEPALRHKALAAAGAACVSAIVVNPLDIVKARACANNEGARGVCHSSRR